MEGAATEQAQAEAQAEAEQGKVEVGAGVEADEEEEVVAKAQTLMDKITSSPDTPSPAVLHSLSSLLETHEARYLQATDHSSTNVRASHTIGRLGNLIRDNDEFFELVSSKYLSENRFSASVQAAAARLLLSCSLGWMYPPVFEDASLDNIKRWVMDETDRSSAEDPKFKLDPGRNVASDYEMLKTYATGLLAISLSNVGQLVEDVLTCGLSAKLMHYLRMRVLGDAGQRDAGHLGESKSMPLASSGRVREESRGRIRPFVDVSHAEDVRVPDERSLDDQDSERNHDGDVHRQAFEEDHWIAREPPDSLMGGLQTHDVDVDVTDRMYSRDARDEKSKFGEFDERDESSRRKTHRGGTKSRGKGRVSEGAVENEPLLTSPGSGGRLGLGRNAREKPSSRHTDMKKVQDTRKLPSRSSDGSTLERDDFVDLIEGCRVGSRDISDLVKEAIRAAEAEAREANAPAEAIRAAAAAAAEVVKSAAFEEFKNTNDEDAAVLAASKAASTVIDAANAVEVSRRSISAVLDSTGPSAAEETDEDVNDYFLPDRESLAQLREKYCIQCLVILGEYVEVLGPVLHEKGVDVCLALLQRSSKNKEPSKIAVLLPEVMKLICALAAHRKFAALFVDRGGMQRLLSVPRVAQTFFGLSSCLFTIGSIQGIMERVCALPSDLVHQVVELAIELLECSQDQARKNAALFFAAAFVFRAVLDAFDAQDGLQKLLGVLNDAASVRSGVNSVSLGLSNSGSLRSDRSSPEVLTSSLKQIAYHTCVALRQYFRAHLLLIVDSIRPSKTNRSAPRNITSVRAAYKPLDISNEAMDAVFLQLQKDRKLGPAFVRTRWPAVDKFLAANGHVTMLELCQAPPVERYLHDLLQYALGVLHIVTLVPQSRKMIVNSTLSNERVGIAVILDAANIASTYVDPEIIQPALSVLINLVCPPPSISNRPPIAAQGQLSVSAQSSNGLAMESRDRNAERSTSDRTVCVTSQHDLRERNGESAGVERGGNTLSGTQSGSAPQTSTSGLVGDRRISLGAGAGSAGLAAQLEQGYRQARDAVRANNGIKVLLHLLQPRIYSPPAALDCIRALACRVLLGLARDDTIAHILTKLQVGKKLSELIRDSGGQTPGGEQGRWQSELAQVAIELIAIVTNSGRASTIAATDAATPTLRRIERAAIAAATPITYHSRELLLLIHEHLQACGLGGTAAMLLKEAQLTPLPSMVAPASLSYTSSMQESSSIQLQWPSGRAPWGFFSEKPRSSVQNECPSVRCDSVALAKKKQLAFSLSFGSQSRNQASFYDGNLQSGKKIPNSTKQATVRDIPIEATAKPGLDNETPCKTPIILPMKRKHSELKDGGLTMSVKRLQVSELGLRSPAPLSPYSFRRGGFSVDTCGFSTPNSSTRDINVRSTPGVLSDVGDDTQYVNSQVGQVTSTDQGFLSDPHSTNVERLTLDSLVVQYLKHQHRQCPAPITTLPPLSLLHPHVCPEPKRSLDAPLNVTARLGTREFRNIYGGVHGNRRDRQFVYSRFRPWRTCRDDNSPLLTCLAFLGNSSHIVAGSHAGELKIFDTNSNSVLDSCTSHQSPLVLVQPYLSGETQLLLTSSIQDVRLWDASSIGNGPLHPFEGCKAARFSNSGTHFAALSSDSSSREILLYDIQTYQMELKLSDSSVGSTGRALMYSHIHFSPSDTMLLWNGVLWDRRVSGPVHRFDQFTDYGGGGFHPAGNEVIINSEVWDLRKFRLLRSVPSLDQTTITFNARGDIIYAILRRSLEDVMSAVHTRRVKHPLFAAFRTVDAINYSDIATVPVDRCVLDFATEPTDSFVGLITMDDQDEMLSSGRVYEIGRRRPTDDDSDPDDAESEEDDEEDEDDDADVDPLLGPDIDGDTDSDPDNMSNDDDSVSDDEDEEDGDFLMDDLEFDGGAGILEIMTEGEDDDEENQMVESFSSDEDDLLGNGFGF